MKFKLKNKQLISLVKYIIFFNVIFLAGSFLFHFYYFRVQNGNWDNGSGIKYLLVEFSLATENVLAAWYSSMLLLSVGIIFFINYLIQKKEFATNKIKAYGWLLISGIFVLLSLDEMASLHERLGNVHEVNPLGDYALGWVTLLAVPIAFVSGFIIWFSLLQAKRAPLAAVCAVAGILLFASIPIQEYYEMKAWEAVDYIETWQRPVGFLLLEEGCELFGTTFMLVSGILFAYNGSTRGQKAAARSFMELRLQLNNRKTVIQCAAGSFILALLMLTIVKSDLLLLEGDHGIRENWFPAAMAFFSSLLCLYLYLRPKISHATLRKTFLYLCLFCLLISAYYGANIYSYMYSTKESIGKMFLVALFSLTTIALAIKFIRNIKDLYIKAAVVLWACLVTASFGILTWHSAALTFIGFSILCVSFLHLITSKIPVNSTTTVTNKKMV